MAIESAGTERGTERVEAFSDGVMAIAITLLILEVKVPHTPGTSTNLLKDLLRLWPSYFALVLSFVMIGIYWANHHYVFKLFEKTDHSLNLFNLLFLLCISFLPFPTDVLGSYVLDEANQTTAVIAHPVSVRGCMGRLTASTKRRTSSTEARLSFAVLTTERNAA